MSVFNKMLQRGESRAEAQLSALQGAVARQGGAFVQADTVKAVLAMESLQVDSQAQLKRSIEDLRHAIKSSYAGQEMSLAQESAGVVAGMLAGAPRDALRGVRGSASQLQSLASENVAVVTAGMGVENVGRVQTLATEAYDNRGNENIVSYSMRYNIGASKQEPMAEMFFPAITMLPDQYAFETSIRLQLLQNDSRHALNGAKLDLNRRNIIKGFVDATLLANDSVRLFPIVRTGGANDTTAYFAADVPPRTIVTHDNATVTTAPLAIGRDFNLLGLSQSDAVIANGQLDVTDAIDSSARLDKIYVKLGAAGGNAVIPFDVTSLPLSHFNQAVQGNVRKLQLNFETDSLKVTATTTKIDGSTVTELAALGTNVVRLSATLNGSLVQDTGTGAISALPLKVSVVTAETKERLALTAGAGKAAADLFVGAAIVGFELYANRTNSNIRTRGQQINTQKFRQLYTVPYLSPIHAIRPVGETDVTDADALETLITATNIRTSNDAVSALLKHVADVRTLYSANDTALNQPEAFGVGRYILNVAYHQATIDVETDIDSLTTSERTEDLKALLVNKLRDTAIKLYIESGYGPALTAVKGAGRKVRVLVGCDPEIHQYLMVNGDTRTLSEVFDVRIEHSFDSRMRGKMIVSFGTEEAAGGEMDFMHFGCMAWRPELTVNMPMTRNGQISQELIVQPSFLHVPNLPIAAEITVTNLDKVVAGKVAINTNPQA